MTIMRSRRLYWLLFFTALALRLGFLALRWDALPHWNIDALGYHQLAVNLVTLGRFSLNTEPPFLPDSIRTPGYPLFLAAVYALGGSPRTALLIQATLDALTTLLVADMTRRLTASRAAALLAGLLYAFLPLAWRYAAELYVEGFLTFWLALAFWLALRVSRDEVGHPLVGGLVLGLVAGISVLVKPNVLPLPLLLGGVLVARKRFRPAAVFAAVVLVVLAPWVIRNVQVFGRPMLSAAFSENLARVSGPATLAQAGGESVTPWTPQWEAWYYQLVSEAAQTHPELFATPPQALTPAQALARQSAVSDAALEVIRAHPLAFLRSHLVGAVKGWLPQEQRFWYGWATGNDWERTFPDGILHRLRTAGLAGTPPLALGLFLLFLVWSAVRVGTAAIGLLWLFPRERAFVLAAALFILYATLLPGPIAYDRFHMPIMPLLHVFMAAGCLWLARKWTSRRDQGLFAASSSASHAR
jgi:4-amino-4-deoxy-L-arabinose transferase-like glycosyltransferase